MNIFNEIINAFQAFISNNFLLEKENNNFSYDFNVEEKRKDFGDFSSNATLILCKLLKKSPKEIFEIIDKNFKNDDIQKIEFAGAGFINFYIKDNVYSNYLKKLISNKFNVLSLINNSKENFNIEFISANPTGPLHIGHGRGGIIGDTLVRILRELKYNVTSEFYINDAGAQIEKLGKSLLIRYKQKCGENIELPEDSYHGEYLKDIADELFEKNENKILNNSVEWFSDYGKKILLDELKNTLSSYNIFFDVWFSEKKLHVENKIIEAVEILKKNNAVYETEDGAIWFKATEYGDEKDRVLKRSNGSWTYVAADIAYLKNKIKRGFTKLIMVLGQDHHSFAIRIKGIMQALGYNSDNLKIILYQLVTITHEGELLRLSKRKGNIISLKDIVEVVGTDISRFFYLNKNADAHLDFDVNIALKNDDTNPVYYIHYAYVRIQGILRKFETKYGDFESSVNNNFDYKYENNERVLIKKVSMLQNLLESIIKNLQPHLLSYYLLELTSLFHSFYNSNIFVLNEDKETTIKRICIIKSIYSTFDKCLEMMGMSKPKSM